MIKKYLLLFLVFSVFINCSKDENTPEETTLKEVTHKIVYFTFTPDTGNNSSRLEYEISFTNPNDVPIKGFYKITTNADGLVTSLLSTDKSQCYEIAANSNCTMNFDAEDSFDIGRVNSIELVSVEYTIEE